MEEKLRESDVILAVMMRNPAAGAVGEMHWGLNNGKLLIPIVSDSEAPDYYARFPQYFPLDPTDPSKTESAVAGFLAEKRQSDQTKAALVAQTTLALGLILFSLNPSY